MHKLQQMREDLGFSIQDLAYLTGLSPSTIRGIEQGSEYKTTISVARVLAEAFGCSVLEIFNREELSNLGRPALTGRPIKVTKSTEIKFESGDSVDVFTFTHEHTRVVCEECWTEMSVNGSCLCY